MRALAIVASVLLLLLILLFAKIRITLSYRDAILLRLRYLFLSFTLYPQKKRRRPKRKKKQKRKKSTATASHGKQKGSHGAKKEKHPLRLGDIRFLLSLFKETIEKILEKASRHVRIRVKELYLSVGGEEDAAKAAIEYGLLSQAVSYLLAFLENTGFLKPPKPTAIDLRVNFLERTHRFSIRTEISCPLIFLIPLLISALTEALRIKARLGRHRAAERAKRKTQEEENCHG